MEPITFTDKCTFLVTRNWINSPCCECPSPDQTGTPEEIEAYFNSGLWHDPNCEWYGKDGFDKTIVIEFESKPGCQLILKKYKWVEKE